MDPTLRTKIVTALKEKLPELSPQMRLAAKYIVDHQSEFGLDPIRDTARKASISTYTFVNIAKNLGLSGFEELRQPFRHALVAGPQPQAGPKWLDEVRERGPIGAVYADAAKNALSIVTRSLERQRPEDLEDIVETLVSARNVYLTAVRSSYAMAYYLHYVGRMALPTLELIPRHMNSAIDDLNDAQTGDVLIAITVTPYSRETIEACKFAQNKGVKLLIISDSEVVSPDLAPQHNLVASVLSSHDFGCFAGMLAVIETLLALLMHRCGKAAQTRIKSYEQLRIENNAYWVAQKKH